MVINLLYHFLSNLFRHMTIDVLVVLFFFLSKPHWAHYFDQGGLAVEHVLVRVDPESGQLGQDVDHLDKAPRRTNSEAAMLSTMTLK